MKSESSSQIVSRNFTFSEKTLFKDADILECDHIPDQVLFRDAELEEMAFLIRPGLRGQRPANILCRGLPATGKTTCIQHLFAKSTRPLKKNISCCIKPSPLSTADGH